MSDFDRRYTKVMFRVFESDPPSELWEYFSIAIDDASMTHPRTAKARARNLALPLSFMLISLNKLLSSLD